MTLSSMMTTRIKWSSTLKQKVKGGQIAEILRNQRLSEQSLLRPFTESNLFFRQNSQSSSLWLCLPYYPTPRDLKVENRTDSCSQCRSGALTTGQCLCCMANVIPNLTLTSLDGSQCFPFYTYGEEGSNRRENITDWALDHIPGLLLKTDTISKWDIFPLCLRAPASPFLPRSATKPTSSANFRASPSRLISVHSPRSGHSGWPTIHVDYEVSSRNTRLRQVETPDLPLDWRVEKMRLSKDRDAVCATTTS